LLVVFILTTESNTPFPRAGHYPTDRQSSGGSVTFQPLDRWFCSISFANDGTVTPLRLCP